MEREERERERRGEWVGERERERERKGEGGIHTWYISSKHIAQMTIDCHLAKVVGKYPTLKGIVCHKLTIAAIINACVTYIRTIHELIDDISATYIILLTGN